MFTQLFLFSGNSFAQNTQQVNRVTEEQPWQDKRTYKEELTQKRDRTSKHFHNASGSTTAFLTAGSSLHYLNNGVWSDINNTIESSQSPIYPYMATKNQFHVAYGNSSSAGVKVNISSDEVLFKGNFLFGATHNGQEQIISQSSSFQPSQPVGASITYNQVFPGVNFAAKQMNDAIKYDFIIENNQLLGSSNQNAQELFFRQSIVVPSGSQITTNFGSTETGNSGKIASISVLRNNGEAILKMGMPYYYDAAQNSEGVYGWYTYEYLGNELVVNTVIPAAWAKSPARVFPLTIDPLVNIFPDNTTDWSGSVRNTGATNENASGAFTGRSATSGYWHYWAKFNNSTIPDGSTINTVSGNFYRQITFAYPVAVCRLDFDPPAATGLARFTGIVAATIVYIASVSYPAGNAWSVHALPAGAATDLAASLGSDYFSIGLRTNTTATGNVGRVHSHNQLNRPYLLVDYTPGGPPTTPACFQSVATGNWGDASTWESRDNCLGPWVPATSTPGANSLGVSIQLGHNVTINTAVTCSLMTVQATSRLIVTTGGTLTISNGVGTDLDIIGTLQNTGGAITATGGALININGIYDHSRDGGALPTATWQATSDCKISGMTITTPTNLAQSFGNLTWQSPAQTGNAVLTGINNPVNVQGLFLYASVGGGILDMSNINRSWTGNLYAGAVVALMRGTAVGTSTLTVNNLTINDTYTTLGRVLLNNSTSTASITVTLNVLGNVLINPASNVIVIGMNTFGSATLPISLIDVRGNWTQTNGFSNSAASQSQAVIRFTGTGVKYFNRSAGSFTNINFSVFSPAILDMGNSILNNAGNFTLTSGAGLRIGSADGISASGLLGNIQNTVGTRNFSTASNYIYYNAYGAGQQLTGNGLPSTVASISIENSQGTILTNTSVSVTGIVDNTGLFIIEDSKSLIQGPLSTNTGLGNYRILRQGSASILNYNYWSSPVSSSSINVLGSSSRYRYDPVLGTTTVADDALDPGWVLANGSMAIGSGYAATGSGLVTFNGSVNNAPASSPIQVQVNRPASLVGFNLIGNPFPSAINAATFLTDNSGVLGGTVWLWDQSGGAPFISSDYATINSLGATSGGGTTTPDGYIASGQGFFVFKTNPGLSPAEFRNSQRIVSPNTQFFNSDNISRFWLSLISPQMRYNELLIGFKEDATEGLDNLYDGKKLIGSYSLSFYSRIDQEPYAIQGLPKDNQDRIIPLGMITSENGSHTIQIKNAENFELGELLFLEDRYTGGFHFLNEGVAYTFESEEGEFNDRFYIHVKKGVTVSTVPEYCNDANGKLILISNNLCDWNFTVSTIENEIVFESNCLGEENIVDALLTGIYKVDLYYPLLNYSTQITFEIESSGSMLADFESSSYNVPLEEAILEFYSTGSQGETYSWDFGDSSPTQQGQFVVHAYIQPGIYNVSLLIESGNCSSSSTKEVSITANIDDVTGISSLEKLEVFVAPNPVSTDLKIVFSKPLQESCTIILVDKLGRTVLKEAINKGKSSLSLSTADVSSGIYFLRIDGNDYSEIKQISVVH